MLSLYITSSLLSFFIIFLVKRVFTPTSKLAERYQHRSLAARTFGCATAVVLLLILKRTYQDWTGDSRLLTGFNAVIAYELLSALSNYRLDRESSNLTRLIPISELAYFMFLFLSAIGLLGLAGPHQNAPGETIIRFTKENQLVQIRDGRHQFRLSLAVGIPENAEYYRAETIPISRSLNYTFFLGTDSPRAVPRFTASWNATTADPEAYLLQQTIDARNPDTGSFDIVLTFPDWVGWCKRPVEPDSMIAGSTSAECCWMKIDEIGSGNIQGRFGGTFTFQQSTGGSGYFQIVDGTFHVPYTKSFALEDKK